MEVGLNRAGVVSYIALFVVLLACWVSSAAEAIVLREETEQVRIDVTEESLEEVLLELELGSFSVEPVEIDGRTYHRVHLGSESRMLEKGLPGLPDVRRSLIIPDDGEMRVTVVSETHRDFEGIDIAPSRGPIPRSADPRTIAYEFDPFYESNTWFPEELVSSESPYIMRDVRGMTVAVNPFRYNPGTRTLRVYESVVVRVERVGPGGENVLTRRPGARPHREFERIYGRHFLNYATARGIAPYGRGLVGEPLGGLRYDPIPETGNMLIICYEDFMAAMAPFVEWKERTGTPCELVGVAEAGGTASAIRDYIQQYYDTHGLTFVLLVGDADQLPTLRAHLGSSDPSYALVAGTDVYPDILVGRFSAENVAEVETQVQRSIEYESQPQQGAEWYHRGAGIASDLGPGDDGEFDDEHMDNIRTDLLSSTYTLVDQIYDPDATSALVTIAINEGRGIVNYTGHGATAGWTTSGFTNGDVNALTNENRLPFIWSVACYNGAFEYTTCFGETWLRATNGTEPTGAVATYMSSISQDWDEPMDAQDEMVDLLVAGAKRTFGGLALSGSAHMLDQYGPNGEDEALTWHIFGDPSLWVRTDAPSALVVSHADTIDPSAATIEVITPGVEGALCALYGSGVLYGSALTGPDGTAVIPIGEQLPAEGDLEVNVTATNAVPYFGTVHVGEAYAPAMVLSRSSFSLSGVLPDEVVTDTLTIGNVGEPLSVLHYEIEVVDGGMARASDASAIAVYPESCEPGSTLDLTLSLTNDGEDGEWIEAARLIFPEGVTVNSSTDFTVSDRVLAWNGATGDGAAVSWEGDWWNVVYPGETAVAGVNVTVDESFYGEITAIFSLTGDGRGRPPHAVSGAAVVQTGTSVPLRVISPNGNESWGLGRTRAIEWEPTGGPLEVDIMSSSDGGASWSIVAAGTEDDGHYAWPVSEEASDNCLIRVRLASDPSIWDVSDRSFSIYQPVDWLSVSPAVGNVPAGAEADVELTVDTAGMEDGEYHADLVITSNAGGPVTIPVTLEVGGTGLDDRVPESALLYGNFPNPFGQSTRVAFSIPRAGTVRLSVYTVGGRLVRSLPAEHLDAGRHTVTWDGVDDTGRRLPAGIYLYRLEAPGRDLFGKMAMLR